MSVEVCHVRTRKRAEPYYIGRPSPLGNPFVIGRDGTRAQVISKYRDWLVWALDNPTSAPEQCKAFAELQALAAGGRVKLFCYCAPKACHGDVIKELLELRA